MHLSQAYRSNKEVGKICISRPFIRGVADGGADCGSRQGPHREMRTLHHLMMNLPRIGTLAIVSLLAGPLARLPIDLGAWLLVRWFDGRTR